MIKKIISMILATAICTSFAVNVSAIGSTKEVDPNFVIEANNYEMITSGERSINQVFYWGECDVNPRITMLFNNTKNDDLNFRADPDVEIKLVVVLTSQEKNIDIGYKTKSGSYVELSWDDVKWNGTYAQYTCTWTTDSELYFRPFVSNNTANTITVAAVTLSY